MSEKRRKFDQDFKDGAVRIVLESGRPVAEIARELDVHEGTLANWVHKARVLQQPGVLGESERDELNRLGKEIVELGCSVMSSNDRWSAGSTKRRAAGRDRQYRVSEDRLSDPGRGVVAGVGSVGVVVLQASASPCHTDPATPRPARCSDQGGVRGERRGVRLTAGTC